ncbi:MAG TPA: hypothetical protein VHY32_01140 [Caulobacteraceae bacterium]|nr:hypothetical protein [Caulobacteraceae bacterium]
MKRLALVTFLMAAACSAPPDTNPIKDRPMSKEEAARAKADDEQTRELAKQVENGELSLDEAACSFHGGDWNYERELCERHLVRHQSERGRRLTQDQVLAERVRALAQMTSDQNAAMSIGTDAAATFLKDHPEDYVGAVRKALLADRKAKIMPPYDRRQMIALNVILL